MFPLSNSTRKISNTKGPTQRPVWLLGQGKTCLLTFQRNSVVPNDTAKRLSGRFWGCFTTLGEPLKWVFCGVLFLKMQTPYTNCSVICVRLQRRHNGRDSISNHQPQDCLLNRLFRRRSKKASKLRVTGLCAGNSPGTGEFPAQMTSYAENVSIWWRHHLEIRFSTPCPRWVDVI